MSEASSSNESLSDCALVSPESSLNQKKSTKILERIFGAKDSLQLAMEEMTIANRHRRKAAEAEKRAAQKLAEWAGSSNNVAIADIATRIKEVIDMHAENEHELALKLDRESSALLDLNTTLDELDKATEKCSANRQEMKALKKLPSCQESHAIEILKDLSAKIGTAQEDMMKARSEQHIVNMYIFRRGMKAIADAYLESANKTSTVFGVHRELAELVPALGVENVYDLVYESRGLSKKKVRGLRRSLETGAVPAIPPIREENDMRTPVLLGKPEHRRRSAPLRMGSQWLPQTVSAQSPPPPYSPAGRAVVQQSRRVYPDLQ